MISEFRNKIKVHRAKWVVTDPWTVIENGYVAESGGRIIETGKAGLTDTDYIDHGNGILTPGVINAHTHLELTSLKGRVPYGSGFKNWVASLIHERDNEIVENLYYGAEAGVQDLISTGCAAVCEISTLGITYDALKSSTMAGVWYQELLGENRETEFDFFEENSFLYRSLAGHAPHTTSPDLLIKLKAESNTKNRIFSIHLAESDDENEFLKTGKGQWADFLSSRNIDFSSWGVPAGSPVAYMDKYGLLDDQTLGVHLLTAGKNDFHLLKERKSKVCICPRSNKNLHNRLPDIEGMICAGLCPSIGTDSLASTESLSVFDEMAFINDNYNNISPEQIWTMATLYGAESIGFKNYLGNIESGKMSRLIYIDSEELNKGDVLEYLVSSVKDVSLCNVGDGWSSTN